MNTTIDITLLLKITVKRQGHGWIRADKRLAIMLRDGMQCAYCLGDKAAGLTLDHIVPKVYQGTNEATNLVTACFCCNSKRQDTGITDFCQRQGFDPEAVLQRVNNLCQRSIKDLRKQAKEMLTKKPLHVYTGNSRFVTNNLTP